MACVKTLKEDIKFLDSTFPPKHERFQVLSTSLDELTCQFIAANGDKYRIQAHFTVSPGESLIKQDNG